MSAAIEALRRLCRAGFAAERLFAEDGRPGALMYARQHAGQREVVLVRGERCAWAYRTDHRVDERRPFHIGPGVSLWHQHDDVVTAVHALLTIHGGRSD